MTEKEIIKHHVQLYEYLTNIHKENPSFRFRVRRMNNQNRLDKGYWFNGNTTYLETSFWDYKDNLHQTPVIRVVYYFKNKTWACELIGRDNELREHYFKKMAETLRFTKENDRHAVWKKELISSGDFLAPLIDFIEREKSKIDTYLTVHKDDKIVRFIDDFVFDKDIRKIEAFIGSTKKPSKQLPFAVTELDIQNFQGIKNQSFTFTEDGIVPRWIFLTGENSFGKTVLLRAIAIGLAGDEMKKIGENDGTIIALHGIKNNKDFTNVKIDTDDSPERFEAVAAYGVSRLAALKSNRPVFKTATLFEDDEYLLNIEDKLEKNEAKFKEITKKLEPIIPGLGKIERYVDKTSGNPKIRFYEKDADGVISNTPVGLEQLGTGYRGIFSMIGDMLVKLTNDFEKSIDDIVGVVLIDEIDANLHPKYQYELPKLLCDAFPKVQFIVSTHSPIPLLGLPEKDSLGNDVHAAIFKVSRTEKEGIKAERLDVPFRYLLPNSLYSSPIFGFSDIVPRDTPTEDLATSNHWADVKERIDLQKAFEELRQKQLID